MRVFQRGRGLSLPFKILQEVVVACEHGRQQLHGNLAAQLGIFREPHLAHPSASQQSQQPVAAKHLVFPGTGLYAGLA